jgi:hypothetical protein
MRFKAKVESKRTLFIKRADIYMFCDMFLKARAVKLQEIAVTRECW